MATEQSGPANLFLREPRRASGCGPTDLDDLHATATATAAAIIRAKSALGSGSGVVDVLLRRAGP
jgi:hypothetical protein